jgi:hypothetical protein
MRQVGRTLTAADAGILVGHRVLICDRDAKWSAAVRERLGGAGMRVVQTISCAQCECLRGTFRAVDQSGVSQSDHSDRGAAFPTGYARIRGALPPWAQSPRLGKRVDRGHGTDRPGGPHLSASTPGRSAQLLLSRGVIGSAEWWDITGRIVWKLEDGEPC